MKTSERPPLSATEWIVGHPETILTEAWTDYPRSVAKGLSIRDDHCPPSGNRPYFNVYACSAGDPRSPIQRSTTDTRWQPRTHRILLYILANLLEFTLAPDQMVVAFLLPKKQFLSVPA